MSQVIQMPAYDIVVHSGPQAMLHQLASGQYSQQMVLVDEHTEQHCLPLLTRQFDQLKVIRIPAGESAKRIETCSHIWEQMLHYGADRRSLLINLGGGVIGDMGGFCAATFKRGLDFIQVPTTLLSQVDASVGGKLAIDFAGYKNVVGLFQDPRLVWVNPHFLTTLPSRQLANGMMEMYKHGLIGDQDLYQRLNELTELNELISAALVYQAILVKAVVVEADPFEKGRRKVLNLGHSLGHAVESYLLNGPEEWLHGECIAAGLIMENYISRQKGLLSADLEKEIYSFVSKWYPLPVIPPQADQEIMRYLLHDKKNVGETLIFSLLKNVGDVTEANQVTLTEVQAALAYYRHKTA